MERFEKKTEILNDLLHINRDCSAACQSVITGTIDTPAAYGALRKLAALCRDCIAELHMRLDPTYGDPADAVDLRGGIYRSWEPAGSIFYSMATPEIVSSCEQKVKAMRSAYLQAIHRSDDLSEDVKELLNCQLGRITATSEFIRGCRERSTVYAVSS